jgi:hypothetical protein
MSQTTIDRARRGSTPFDRLFRDHLREVGETYFQHMGASAVFGFRLLRLAGAAFAHAVVPGGGGETDPDARRRGVGRRTVGGSNPPTQTPGHAIAGVHAI